jgi:hypothetical protein
MCGYWLNSANQKTVKRWQGKPIDGEANMNLIARGRVHWRRQQTLSEQADEANALGSALELIEFDCSKRSFAAHDTTPPLRQISATSAGLWLPVVLEKPQKQPKPAEAIRGARRLRYIQNLQLGKHAA